jgi:aryl-alcohol dehydrogenase-like predicted oxidoreductase
MEQRALGRSGIDVSAMGIRRWAIGGRLQMDGKADGYWSSDATGAVEATRRAAELGITVLEPRDVYCTGHSERVLERALSPRRAQVGRGARGRNRQTILAGPKEVSRQ